MTNEEERVDISETISTDLTAHRIMLVIAMKVASGETHISLKRGLKEFGAQGEQAVYKQLDVLHLQKVFAPYDPGFLFNKEKGKALESLMFLE